ncbi:MAG: zinc ribbon domain-containing protein, partial [Anaerolineales bacterium]
MTESFPPPGYITSQSVVDGIEVYMPASLEKETQEEVVDFSCPQCGATTAYSVEDGGLTCSHCGYYEAPPKEVVGKGAQEFEFTVETLERSAHGWGGDRNEIECQNCGAVTSVPIESLTHTCAFCGSNKVMQRQAIQDILRPKFLIPFKLEIMNCRVIARDWLGNSWIVPSKLHNIA